MDFNTAQIMSLIYNITVQLWGKKGQAKLSTPMEFMTEWGKEEESKEEGQSVAQMKEVLMGIAKMQNEHVKRNPPKDRRSLYKKRKGVK